MAQLSTSKIEVEIEASANDFYETLKATSRSVPKMSPQRILNVEVQQGAHGCVKTWTLAVDGKIETMKERVEVDDQNKSITFLVFGGEVMEHYKDFKCNLKVIPRSKGGIARWTWEYEKLYDEAPIPHKYMDFATNLTKDINYNLLSNKGIGMGEIR